MRRRRAAGQRRRTSARHPSTRACARYRLPRVRTFSAVSREVVRCPDRPERKSKFVASRSVLPGFSSPDSDFLGWDFLGHAFLGHGVSGSGPHAQASQTRGRWCAHGKCRTRMKTARRARCAERPKTRSGIAHMMRSRTGSGFLLNQRLIEMEDQPGAARRPRTRRACFSFRYRCLAARPFVLVAPFRILRASSPESSCHVTALSVTGQISRLP